MEKQEQKEKKNEMKSENCEKKFKARLLKAIQHVDL